jgi:glycosyltransferase involved in cell wall biosynthesis
MRILLVSYYPLPYAGGLWAVVANLRKKLNEMGHTVDIFGQRPDLSGYRIIDRDRGFTLEQQRPAIHKRILATYPECTSHPLVLQAETYRLNFELTLQEYGLGGYDIIHAQDVTAARTIGEMINVIPPLVTSAHGCLTKEIYYVLKSLHPNWTDQTVYNSFEYYYYKYNERHGYTSSRLIHTQSIWMKGEILKNFSIHPQKVISFPLGIENTQHGKPIQKGAHEKVILFSGRLIHLKGVTVLIEALKLLKKERKDWVCWIAGGGDMEAALKKMTAAYGLQNSVKFLGVQTSMEPILAMADFLVLPSLQDTQPLSVVEAQFAGLPVIVSNAAGLPEMVRQGYNGFIVPAGNSRALSLKMKELLERDPLRVVMGQQSQVWAKEHWSLDGMAAKTLEFYSRA